MNLRALLILLLFSSLVFARGGGGCFVPGTLIGTSSGSIEIEKLKPGDPVLSFAEGGSSGSSVSHVVAVYERTAPSIYEIQTESTSIEVTGEHLISIGGGKFKEAKNLGNDEKIQVLSEGVITLAPIKSINVCQTSQVVYNLLTDNQNTFFANGILVHNKGCFLPDTQIIAADGSERKISEMRKGDSIRAFTYDGEVVNASVEEIYSAQSDGYYLIRTDNYEVRVTSEHPFYVGNGEFIVAESLAPGDRIFVFNGDNLAEETVAFKERVGEKVTVYNLRTDWPNTYFANFIAVHNKGGGGGCFAAGTLVSTQEGQKAIESLRESDSVLAVDQTGRLESVKVLETFKTESEMIAIRTVSGRSVVTTSEHPFLTPEGFKLASELKAGDIVILYDWQERGEAIFSISRVGFGEVYNLRVETPDTFIANGFVVHNKGGGGSSGPSYSSNTYCGLSKSVSLDNGTILVGSECYYVRYLTSSSSSASTLGNCVLATADPWSKCAGLETFASTREKQFKCLNQTQCEGTDFVAINGNKVKVWKPATLVDTLFGMAGCLCPLSFFIIAIVVVFASKRSAKFGAISFSSSEDLDYCYPEKQITPKAQRTAKLLGYLKGIDKTWDAESMKSTARSTFLKLQECWQSREYSPMKPLLMPYLYAQHLDQINSLIRNHEIDMIEGVQIRKLEIVQLRHYQKKEQQEFTVLFEASARDYYVDDRTKAFIRGDTSPATFQEFWVFQRQNDNWLLREINQTRESNAIREENFVEELTPEQLKGIYGSLASQPSEKAPWLEETLSQKGDKIHRMLNFLSSSDKVWDEDFMKEASRKAFVAVLASFESGDLSSAKPLLMPEAVSHYEGQLSRMKQDKSSVEYRNMCVRKIDIVLVKNLHDNSRDEFTARISAHAQRAESVGGKVTRKDQYVTPFEEYWTFQRNGAEWKLREVQPPAKVKSILTQENVDEEVSKEMVQWYYTKDRAL